jgi:hypothetical protein
MRRFLLGVLVALLGPILAAFLTARLGFFSVHATGEPPAWEVRLAQWGTEGFYPRVPQFAQSPPQQPDWQLLWILRHGIRYSGMGAWREAMLSDKEAWEVVTFLSRLNSLPAAVQAAWQREH